ncbi:MAG: hypothetical protein ACLT2T_08245 [Bilophila wadsworthia]
MALKNMTYSLYSKIALWLVLNLVLLAVLGFGIGWYVLLGNGLVPAHFSARTSKTRSASSA